ncbi:hypothetical protein K435DRAFT_875813 [Dendrothele bispora CBS 962.96]|uniref:Uncharacterized protein n=1 Tax=Dendrothele bispora (strain CBS 962.96) TaxID=1314807 RepID=A0A4V4HBE8_DENBC|nr:hypothetical protein K435DRAFT_875813 [Dendrothele bispora CBS 962.96]
MYLGVRHCNLILSTDCNILLPSLDTEIHLARVMSLYSKDGSKADYQWTGLRRKFSTVHTDRGMNLGHGLRRFAHIPSNSFLLLSSKPDSISVTRDGVQVSDNAWKLYQSLSDEKEMIFAAVKDLGKRQKTQGSTGEEEINENFE